MEITVDWTDRNQRERLQRSCPHSTVLFCLCALFDWYLLMPAAAHPYFISISHRMQWMLKMIAGHSRPFNRRAKISYYFSFWLWSVAPASGLTVSRAVFYCSESWILLIQHCVTDHRISWPFSVPFAVTIYMQYQLGTYFTSRVNTKNEHDQVVLHCREQLKGQEGLDCHFHLYKPCKTEKNRQSPPPTRPMTIIWGYKWLFDCGLVLATKTFCSVFYLSVCAEVAPSRELCSQ